MSKLLIFLISWGTTLQALASRPAHEILNLKPTASAEELKARYWELAKKFHPDVNQEPDAQVHFAEINEAYQKMDRRLQSRDQGESPQSLLQKIDPYPTSLPFLMGNASFNANILNQILNLIQELESALHSRNFERAEKVVSALFGHSLPGDEWAAIAFIRTHPPGHALSEAELSFLMKYSGNRDFLFRLLEGYSEKTRAGKESTRVQGLIQTTPLTKLKPLLAISLRKRENEISMTNFTRVAGMVLGHLLEQPELTRHLYFTWIQVEFPEVGRLFTSCLSDFYAANPRDKDLDFMFHEMLKSQDFFFSYFSDFLAIRAQEGVWNLDELRPLMLATKTPTNYNLRDLALYIGEEKTAEFLRYFLKLRNPAERSQIQAQLTSGEGLLLSPDLQKRLLKEFEHTPCQDALVGVQLKFNFPSSQLELPF